MARDTRFKDAEFTLDNGSGQCATWTNAQLAALYDIRDELKRLNSVLNCPNFQAIPRKLDRISKNTAKPRKRRSKANRGEKR